MRRSFLITAVSAVAARAVRVEVPLLDAAMWALSAEGPKACASQPTFEACKDPWAAAEAWRYAASNVLAAVLQGSAPDLRTTAVEAAKTLGAFFSEPGPETLERAARHTRRLQRRLLREAERPQGLPQQALHLDGAAGLGVPFPVSKVLIPRVPAEATLQLRSGPPMPLLALAMRRDSRPSIAGIAEALRLGVRHLEVSPSAAEAVARAIERSGVPRGELFLSVPWELPLNAEERLDELLRALRTPHVDLLQLPRGPDAAAGWRLLQRLRRRGKVRILGVRGFRPQELDELPQGGADVEYAQCAFTPYHPGPSRATWQLFGQRSIALAASGVMTDWPHALPPTQDPHVLAVARRMGRTAPQVLIRWALQLGLAVVFRTGVREHVAENVAALDFELPEAEMQLLSSLATLAEPAIPPGDGFSHVYTSGVTRRQEL